MAEPSYKAPGMEKFLEDFFGRTTAIRADKCLNPPAGCGGDAKEFRDERSAREYTISGLCQKCQDEVFNPPNVPGPPMMEGD
jgi:hypothetical protein